MPVPTTPSPLFYLDARRCFRLSIADNGWLLERRLGDSAPGGVECCYEAERAVSGSKMDLLDCIRSRGIALSSPAAALLQAMPWTFVDCLQHVRRAGVAGFRIWLDDVSGVSLGLASSPCDD